MKQTKRICAVVLALVMVAVSSLPCMTSAEDAKESVEGIRWFPADMTRNNGYDDIWEVDCGPNECQRFNEADSNPDAAEPHLSTTYDANGALTLQRTGADGNGDLYWPRVRTLYLENAPVIDLNTADTLYYDFEATGCKWMINLTFSGMEVKLGKAICGAAGTATLANSDEDGVAGTYKGSIKLTDVISAIASDSADPHATEMTALQSMKKTFVPQLLIFLVGDTKGTLKINSLYLSSAQDASGDTCDLMDMGLIYGDEVYDLADNGVDDTASDDGAESTTTTAKAAAATTTKAAANTASNAGFPMWAIIAIIAGVVVVVVIVVVVVVVSKKKGGTDTTPPAPPAQ